MSEPVRSLRDSEHDASQGPGIAPGSARSRQRPHRSAKVDAAAWERRRERLGTILSAMADHAMVQASFRCPYKNRHDECTAKFGCRNQRRPRPGGDLLMCGGDDKLDYRSAWETDAAPDDTR